MRLNSGDQENSKIRPQFSKVGVGGHGQVGKIMILAHTDGEGFNNYIHTSHKITAEAFLNVDIDIEFILHFPNRYSEMQKAASVASMLVLIYGLSTCIWHSCDNLLSVNSCANFCVSAST